MSKTIWHITLSVDGFIAGPDHAMGWAFTAPAADTAVADAVRTSTGAILGGRGWYDVASAKYDGVAGIYGGAWSGPVYVLTHRPGDAPDDPAATFLSDGLQAAIATAADAAGEHNLEIFGADIARQCLAAGLIDEIVVHLAPVLLGDGVRLYDAVGGEPVALELIAGSESGQVVDLRYAVATS